MINGILWVLGCQLVGEVFVRSLGLSIPGPVVGMVLLFAVLSVRRPGEVSGTLRFSDGLLRQSSDPYILMREAYFQRHDFIANGGKLKPEENPNAKDIQDDLKEIDSE
mgnify:CR=1 FL=1